MISDEIYEKLIYDGQRHVSVASLGNEIVRRSIIVNGVSKAYSMTGWRIGFLAAPKNIISAILRLQSHSTSNPVSISQKAALQALKVKDYRLAAARKRFEGRRDLMCAALDGIDAVTYSRPAGAFYVYCDISRTGMKASVFAKRLLKEKLVAVIPGEGFGSDRHIRLSFATDAVAIRKGMERLKIWVER